MSWFEVSFERIIEFWALGELHAFLLAFNRLDIRWQCRIFCLMVFRLMHALFEYNEDRDFACELLFALRLDLRKYVHGHICASVPH